MTFHIAIVDQPHFVPGVPDRSFDKYGHALRWVAEEGFVSGADMKQVINHLGTMTGDLGDWEAGTAERVKILDEWQFVGGDRDGKFVHIYQIQQ